MTGSPPSQKTSLMLTLLEDLPPAALWPDYVFTLPELQYPETLNLAQTLLAHADAAPDAIAFRHAGQTVSYASLRQHTAQLAGGLAELGVAPGTRVGLRLPNSPAFAAAWLASQWLGAICVPIPAAYRRREIAHILAHSGTSVIVCDEEFRAELARMDDVVPPGVAIVALDRLPSSSRHIDACPRRRDDPAALTYITSADGGLKAAVHSASDILASADTYGRRVLALTASDICAGTTSLSWAYGLGALLTMPLRAGAAVLLPDAPLPLLQAIAEHRATVLFGVPTLYRMLLQFPDLERWNLRSLRCCVSAAEPLPIEVTERWRARTGLEIIDSFGTTELTHVFISNRPGTIRPGRIGTVVDGYEARIVDEDMRDVPDGTAGLLAVRGPTGARYWRDVDAQRRVVRGGWTLTGDRCARHDDGSFTHLGRADALVVSAGYKISPREVEAVLTAHADVAAARVFSVPDPVRGATTHAVVVAAAHADRHELPERLQRYLKGELAPFKCPREIRIE